MMPQTVKEKFPIYIYACAQTKESGSDRDLNKLGDNESYDNEVDLRAHKMAPL